MLFNRFFLSVLVLGAVGVCQDTDDTPMPLPGDLRKKGATTATGKEIAAIIQGTVAGENNTKGAVPSIAQRAKLKCGAWYNVTDALTKNFKTNGTCNDLARAAIRAGFHDAGTWSINLADNKKQDYGGADGSLYLFQEYNRGENSGLQKVSTFLGELARTSNVTIADMFQFASAHATVTCRQGPRMRTWVGRINGKQAAPDGLLPNTHDTATNLDKLFRDKTIGPEDLAALLGAHSSAKQFTTNTTFAGQALDTTVDDWDVNLYSEILKGPQKNVFQLPSDIALAKYGPVNKEWVKFVNDQHHWNEDYARAFLRLSLLGVNNINTGLYECTDALPAAHYQPGTEGIAAVDDDDVAARLRR